MELDELAYKAQQLSQAAGRAYNEQKELECRALLAELRTLLIEQTFVTEKAETPPPAEETETDQPEQAPPGEETQDGPGPEAQPSED